VFPGAVEVADDGVDQDCDGADVVTELDTGLSGEPEEPQSCGGCSTGTGPGLLLIGLAGVFARRRRRA
jgi:MYXO-CTERM domain-containing protein